MGCGGSSLVGGKRRRGTKKRGRGTKKHGKKGTRRRVKRR